MGQLYRGIRVSESPIRVGFDIYTNVAYLSLIGDIIGDDIIGDRHNDIIGDRPQFIGVKGGRPQFILKLGGSILN